MVWPGGKKGPLSFKMLQINLYYLNDTYSSASLSLSSMQRKKRKLINHYKELPTNFMLNTKTKCIREMNLKCL